ncbi:MAG: hypothetical protein K2J80_06070 [Oscillospiraceae bacterium]|nr:hypothetical protein [Oscillospiraceae bacterium]
MDDTKKLIEKYKRELMELSKTAPQAAKQTAPQAAEQTAPKSAPEKKAVEEKPVKAPKVIGYVTEESGEFPPVFDRLITEAVENNEVEKVRVEGPSGYPDIDSEPGNDASGGDFMDFPDELSIDNTDDPNDRDNERNMNEPETDNATARPEDNMDQGTGESISNFPVSRYSTVEAFEAGNTGGGSLVFMVFTASSALPVDGAEISVTTRIDGTNHKMFDTITNNSGETAAQTLPAPSKELSQHAENDVQPFSLYDATVSKEGFAKTFLRDIPIFDGVQSIQRVAMIPELSELSNGSSPIEKITEVRNAE